jgi:hypothetical protein
MVALVKGSDVCRARVGAHRAERVPDHQGRQQQHLRGDVGPGAAALAAALGDDSRRGPRAHAGAGDDVDAHRARRERSRGVDGASRSARRRRRARRATRSAWSRRCSLASAPSASPARKPSLVRSGSSVASHVALAPANGAPPAERGQSSNALVGRKPSFDMGQHALLLDDDINDEDEPPPPPDEDDPMSALAALASNVIETTSRDDLFCQEFIRRVDRKSGAQSIWRRRQQRAEHE